MSKVTISKAYQNCKVSRLSDIVNEMLNVTGETSLITKLVKTIKGSVVLQD